MIELTIDSIRVSLVNYRRVVILKEKDSERYLPIWIGPAEADAIAIKLRGEAMPRPLTHDLLVSITNNLGASVNSVVINDLKSDTFFAKIILNVDDGQMEIDSRPSDALALAVAAENEVPIYAEDSVLERAGILLDKETGKPILEDGEPMEAGEGKKAPDEEELKKLSAFNDFINTLDLEDFDKRKKP